MRHLKTGGLRFFRTLGIGMLIITLMLAGCGGKGDAKSGDKKNNKKAKEAATESVDNSVPITELKVTCPQTFMRVGDEVPLDVQIIPEDASNPKLKWTFSDAEDYIDVSSEGVLTAESGAERNDVTVTAKTTDGSKLEQSFKIKIYPEIDPGQPMIAITFDDGPNPETTNAILDIMGENYARATFFVLGKCAQAYPKEVKREYDLGMEVGSHTWSHSDNPTFPNMSEEQQKKELEDANAAIEKAGVPTPTVMRPPYGANNDRVKNVIKSYNLNIVNWNLDTEDWKYRSSDHTYQEIMKVQDGDIILLHDIHAFNVDAVKRAVPELIDKGYQFLTVTELYNTFYKNNEGYNERNHFDEFVPDGSVHNRPETRMWPSEFNQTDGESSEESTAAEATTQNPILQDDGVEGE